MNQGLNEVLALYQASVRKTPNLMMETVSVDSNRGVTTRGNSPYDKFASPATRAKVLEARLQDIEAFARSRSIPTSNVYAAAEAAMRTGKIPDLGQFGLAGDDAVALKQFLISDVLNIAGLEWTDYKGDPVEATGEFKEADGEGMRKGTQFHTGEYGGARGGRPDSGRINKAQLKVGKTKRRRAGRDAAETGQVEYEVARHTESYPSNDPRRYMSEADEARREIEVRKSERSRKVAKRPRRPGGLEFEPQEDVGVDPSSFVIEGSGGEKRLARKARRSWNSDPTSHDLFMSDVNVDPANFMVEGGLVGAPESASLSPTRTSGTGESPINPMSYMRHDLLPKAIMAKLRQTVGDGVYGYSREDLFRLAREHGLLGTEEWVQESKKPDAEMILRARRAAHATSKKETAKRKSGKGSATREQIARGLATQQYLLAKGAADQGKTLPGTLDQQDIESGIGTSAIGSKPRLRAQARQAELGDFQQRLGGITKLQKTGAKSLAADVDPDGALLTELAHLGGGSAPGGTADGLSGQPGPTMAPWESKMKEEAEKEEEEEKKKKQTEEERLLGILPGDPRGEAWPKLGDELRALIGEDILKNGIFQDVADADRRIARETGITQEEREAEEKALRERSDSDKILGIVAGDPRAESWPKMSGEMQRLMNLESCGVFRGPRGFDMPETPGQIEEMTTSGGIGAFIGGGMVGSGLTGRTCAMPSYDDSYELPEDPEQRLKLLKKMLDKHGLKKPVEEK